MATSEFNRHESGQIAPMPAKAAPEEELVEEWASDKAIAAMMPWMLSVFFHLGVGLIAGFITVVTVHQVNKQTDGTAICFPDDQFSESSGGVTDPGTPGRVINPGDPGTGDCARQQVSVCGNLHNDVELTSSVSHAGRMDPRLTPIDIGGPASNGRLPTGPAPIGGIVEGGPGNSGNSGGNGHGPKSAFIGCGGNAHHVVYCIDASGSMAFASKNGGSVFDVVREQMLRSISRLSPVQDFDIVMFQEGPVVELPANRLQPVTPEGRIGAARWLSQVVPHGAGSDPVPALNRAFDVLAQADKTRKGKQIFLLTDGAFPNNDAVLRCIRERNKAHDVHVFTYLYGEQDDDSIVKLMKTIAAESGGKYKNIAE